MSEKGVRWIVMYLQDWDGVVGELVNLLLIRCLVGRRVTPAVIIEGEEIASLIIGTTIEVVSSLDTVVICIPSMYDLRHEIRLARTDVCGRVTNRDRTIATVAHILLHVSGDSLDVRSGVTRRNIVDKFVSGEEKESVVVFLELVDGSEYVLEVDGVVRLARFVSSDGVFGGVDIQSEVDASIGQLFHAFGMVLAVIDGVDANGIDLQLLEPRCLDERDPG